MVSGVILYILWQLVKQSFQEEEIEHLPPFLGSVVQLYTGSIWTAYTWIDRG